MVMEKDLLTVLRTAGHTRNLATHRPPLECLRWGVAALANDRFWPTAADHEGLLWVDFVEKVRFGFQGKKVSA
jgi:hypothetical protein